MAERILLTTPFEVRISNGIAYLGSTSNGETIELAMALQLFITSYRNIAAAIDATNR